jgi:hypothetical protein
MGNPRRHPRSPPPFRLRHHLLATPPQHLKVLGVLKKAWITAARTGNAGTARAVLDDSTTVQASLASRGAVAVALDCTEIPLLVTPDVSSLPTLDSTRLLASAALTRAIDATRTSRSR